MATERGLTSGETGLCRMVFQESVPTGIIRLVERRAIFGGYTPFSTINLGPESYVADFIGNHLMRPSDPEDAHFFLHEMVHVWQHFVGMPKIRMFFRASRQGRRLQRRLGKTGGFGSYHHHAAVYSYDASKPGLDLLDFNLEQQADIIADYYALTLWGFRPRPNWSDWPVPTEQQLLAVLARFHEDPAYPARESRGNARRAGRRD